MAKDTPIRHVFDGGWATDFGTIAHVDVGPEIRLPFLLRADNLFYTLQGGTRKAGGTSKYNATALESGEEIRGMFEFVRLGSSGSATRKRVVYAGTKILKDDNDAAFTSIFTGLADNTVPNFNVFEDVLILASDSTSDVPRKWDQTTAAVLGGSPPVFSFSVNHVNRVWAAGDFANPSRLYFSSLLNAEEWNGVGDSGSIDIDPSDGDMITGIIPFRGELVVFKGPNKGSIHRISGRTPATFARDTMTNEVGTVWQNLVFPFGNDVAFVDPYGQIRSLLVTDRYGDLETATLSRPLSTWIIEHVNVSALRKGWAAVDNARGYALITLPVDGSTTPNLVVLMDFRFQNGMRFAKWDAFNGYSVARMSDPADDDRPILYLGGRDGFIRKTQQATRAIDTNTAIPMYLRTPVLHYNSQNRLKTLQHFGLGLRQRTSLTLTFTLRKGATTNTNVVDLAANGFTLGTGSPNPFVLGTSTLAGDEYITYWSDTVGSGQFREVSYEISSLAVNEDIELDTLHTVFETEANPSYEN